jgi:hypothetical protein
MTQPEKTNFELLIRPEGSGWRVTVMEAAGRHSVATTIENTPYEAAVIGVGLWHRWKAAQ